MFFSITNSKKKQFLHIVDEKIDFLIYAVRFLECFFNPQTKVTHQILLSKVKPKVLVQGLKMTAIVDYLGMWQVSRSYLHACGSDIEYSDHLESLE